MLQTASHTTPQWPAGQRVRRLLSRERKRTADSESSYTIGLGQPRQPKVTESEAVGTDAAEASNEYRDGGVFSHAGKSDGRTDTQTLGQKGVRICSCQLPTRSTGNRAKEEVNGRNKGQSSQSHKPSKRGQQYYLEDEEAVKVKEVINTMLNMLKMYLGDPVIRAAMEAATDKALLMKTIVKAGFKACEAQHTVLDLEEKLQVNEAQAEYKEKIHEIRATKLQKTQSVTREEAELNEE